MKKSIRHIQCCTRIILALLCILFSGGRTKAQTTISAYDITLAGSNTAMSVAWHPAYSRYYASSGGGSDSPVTTFSSTGSLLSTTTHNFDNRGFWYNASNSRIEGTSYGTGDYGYYPLDGSGTPNGNVSLYGYSGTPGDQSGGIRNANNGEILFYTGTSYFYRYNTSGTQLGIVNITVPGGATFNNSHMIYTGISGQEVGFYDYTNRRVYLYSIAGGSYSYYYSLPASAPNPGSFGFAYANGRFFLASNGTWYGYPTTATAPSNPSSVTATYNILCNGASTTLTAIGAVGTVYWYTGSCGGTQVTTGNPVIVSPSSSTTYYARNFNNGQFSAGCASISIVGNPRPTVADLQATGTGIKWYLTSSGGTALASDVQLQNNTHYYASQTVNGVESTTRLDVLVTMTNP